MTWSGPAKATTGEIQNPIIHIRLIFKLLILYGPQMLEVSPWPLAGVQVNDKRMGAAVEPCQSNQLNREHLRSHDTSKT